MAAEESPADAGIADVRDRGTSASIFDAASGNLAALRQHLQSIKAVESIDESVDAIIELASLDECSLQDCQILLYEFRYQLGVRQAEMPGRLQPIVKQCTSIVMSMVGVADANVFVLDRMHCDRPWEACLACYSLSFAVSRDPTCAATLLDLGVFPTTMQLLAV